MKVERVWEAEEARRVVPSGDLGCMLVYFFGLVGWKVGKDKDQRTLLKLFCSWQLSAK